MLDKKQLADEKVREASRYIMVALEEYQMCIAGRAWSPQKVVQNAGKALQLYEEALRIYEEIGARDSASFISVKTIAELARRMYQNAKTGTCN